MNVLIYKTNYDDTYPEEVLKASDLPQSRFAYSNVRDEDNEPCVRTNIESLADLKELLGVLNAVPGTMFAKTVTFNDDFMIICLYEEYWF